MTNPLTGLKVIEMAGLGPCPLAGQLLADQGAEVTVIDRPGKKPDLQDVNSRGKHFVGIDLKSEEGRAEALGLIGKADILIEGFRPGVMERLGLGPDECLSLNKALIYGRMTGWGQTGPLSQTAGHDINYLAVTGLLHAIGPEDRPPFPPLNLAADYGGGTMFLLFGVLAALYDRSRTGEGQVIDVAMSDCAPALAGLIYTMLGKGQWSEKREANLLDGGAPFYRCYETLDGKYIALGALEPNFFAEFVRLADLDEALKELQYDRSCWPSMQRQFETMFGSKTRQEWMKLFEGSDACVAPVLSFSEAAAHPHNLSREVFLQSSDIPQVRPVPVFSRKR